MKPSDLPKATFEIRRSIWPYLFGLGVCSVFIVAWMLERFRGMGAEFILSPGFSAFIFLFVAPVAGHRHVEPGGYLPGFLVSCRLATATRRGV